MARRELWSFHVHMHELLVKKYPEKGEMTKRETTISWKDIKLNWYATYSRLLWNSVHMLERNNLGRNVTSFNHKIDHSFFKDQRRWKMWSSVSILLQRKIRKLYRNKFETDRCPDISCFLVELCIIHERRMLIFNRRR